MGRTVNQPSILIILTGINYSHLQPRVFMLLSTLNSISRLLWIPVRVSHVANTVNIDLCKAALLNAVRLWQNEILWHTNVKKALVQCR